MAEYTDISYNQEAASKIIAGVEKLANAVEPTLGPNGRCVMIDQAVDCRVTKDGVTVAKSIELEDPHENAGAKFVKQAANNVANDAGDGTTTTTVLTRSVIVSANSAIASGISSVDITRGIKIAKKHILDFLSQKSKVIKDNIEIEQVGTLSANGDVEIGRKIAHAIEKVGKDGVITVQESNGRSFDVETVTGMQFDRGYISPYFITNSEKGTAELVNPLIFVFDKKMSSMQPIVKILEEVSRTGKSLLIIAEDVDGEALAGLVINRMRGTLHCAAVKAPGFGDRRKEMLEDIAILTGATFITEETGYQLENINFDQLGSAKNIKITKDHTIIVDGAGEADAINSRCELIKKQISDTSSDYEKEKLQERLARLKGGIAVLKVGGTSEIALKERKDRVEDALNATRAAIEDGIVPGGGIALYSAGKYLLDLLGEKDEYKLENYDSSSFSKNKSDNSKLEYQNDAQRLGIKIVAKSLYDPLKAIIKNSGKNYAAILFKLNEGNRDFNCGYDAREDRIVNMLDQGIIDPTKVSKNVVEQALTAAEMSLSSSVLIVKKEKASSKNESAAPQPHGYM